MSVKPIDYTSTINLYKQEINRMATDAPRQSWKPLKVEPHPQQARMDAYNAIPSRETK